MVRRNKEQEEEHFFKKTLISPFSECWIWLKPALHGYGKFVFYDRGKREQNAHRYSFRMFNGPLIQGMHIDHICRNRACVNPDHLRQVTPRINALENSEGPAPKNAKKTHCSHGHPYSGDNLRIGSRGFRKCRICDRKQALGYYYAKGKANRTLNKIAAKAKEIP